ncbi:YciI family protein [Deinococcus sp. Marseille-Q6407]|uniref:YciI family protein n=1 Tax=Deinococcus sp. Marseille-Q6407 TaxID=2969223 RepID=UPI0021BF87A6|nr:YciI family protein [Deinococcus sp. Marseille-Q6407]
MSNLHVILVKYTAPTAEVEAATPAHRDWLDQHYRSGLFITSGPQEPRTGGLILAAGESKEQLLDVMQDDPFHKAGVAEYEIIEFRPVKRGKMIELDGVPLVE